MTQQIKIGTCIPGDHIDKLGPAMVKAGFESVAINFHMEYNQGDMAAFAKRVLAMLEGTGTVVSSIGYYCNALENEEQRKTLAQFIDAAPLFGTNIVSTFAGALEGQPVEAAMPRFKEVYGELAKRAEGNGIKIAIENCPMGGTWQRSTCNIGFCPASWEMMFHEVPSDSLGLEWEPAHQMCQLIDPIPQLKAWIGKVYHVHGKDAVIDWDAVRRHGVFGSREVVTSRTPGFGETDWREIFYILYQNKYEGDIVVEGFHDAVFGGEREMQGQLHALQYLTWCRGGAATPTPWA